MSSNKNKLPEEGPNHYEEIDITPKASVSEFVQLAPHLDWENASIVPWIECVRDSEKQPEATTDLQKIYFKNQQTVRLRFLKMLGAILTSEIKNLSDFRDHFIELHKVLILDQDGKSIYMSPGHKTVTETSSPKDIAGKMPDDDGVKLQDLLTRLINFLKPENFSEHSQLELIQQIGKVYFQNLNLYPVSFAYGNNSLNMNIINGLLRLMGLNGIPHGWIDIEFMCGMNAERFPEAFTTAVKKTNPEIK